MCGKIKDGPSVRTLMKRQRRQRRQRRREHIIATMPSLIDMQHFILCLRRQLRGSQIKVVEIIPPAVQTELHDEKHQPDIKNGRLMGMPLDEFTDEAYRGLIEGLDQIPVGISKMIFDAFEAKRQEIFNSF